MSSTINDIRVRHLVNILKRDHYGSGNTIPAEVLAEKFNREARVDYRAIDLRALLRYARIEMREDIGSNNQGFYYISNLDEYDAVVAQLESRAIEANVLARTVLQNRNRYYERVRGGPLFSGLE